MFVKYVVLTQLIALFGVNSFTTAALCCVIDFFLMWLVCREDVVEKDVFKVIASLFVSLNALIVFFPMCLQVARFLASYLFPRNYIDLTFFSHVKHILFVLYTDWYALNRITLNFWDELAEISLEYLKPRDIIFVSGTLGTYDRVNDFGENEMHYQVGTCSLCYLFFFCCS